MFNAPGVLFPPYYPQEEGVDHIMFGNMAGGPNPIHGTNLYYNPYSDMVRGYSNRSESTNIVSFELNQDLSRFIEGWKVNGLISFRNFTKTTITRDFDPFYYGLEDYDPAGSWYTLTSLTRGTTALGYSSVTEGNRSMNLQFSTDYNRIFADVHNVSAMLVYLQRDYNINVPGSYSASLPTRNQGFAGRLTYAYDSRYLAETNFGYNGSENFAKGSRFGFFPSFALGYNISEEAFWDPVRNTVSALKVRGSWGIVGNADTGTNRFPYLTLVTLGGRQYTVGNNWQTTKSGAVITRYGADGATWERGYKRNIGVDMMLFNALDISADVYNETRTGIFMQYRTIPIESGISGGLIPFHNLGKVKNEGVDLSVNYNKQVNRDLFVNFRGTFTYAKNTLLDRDEPLATPWYMSELGRPLNRNMGFIAIGLFESQEDIDNSPRQQLGAYTVGDIKYADLNGDGMIDDNDRTQIGDPTVPQIMWGAGVSAQYKKVDFSVFFQGVAKTSIMMGDIHPYSDLSSQLYQFIADDYWSESNPNPNAAYPRIAIKQGSGIHNNHKASTFWLRNGSFFRLKNIEFGYTHKFARIYLSGQNVFTFSPFKHWDPELGGVGSHGGESGYSGNRGRGLIYPAQRVFSAGVQFTL
jgi:TonB-linked SusC/RagA family outer membrane protein